MNDLIKRIPHLLIREELKLALSKKPFIRINQRTDMSERLIQLTDIMNAYFPTEMSFEIYETLYFSLVRSFQRKAKRTSNMRKELLQGLTEEQVTKLRACKSQEELLALAKEEGIELTDEQLVAVSGGCFTEPPAPPCPHCGSHNTKHNGSFDDGMGYGSGSDYPYYCKNCRQYFGSRK